MTDPAGLSFQVSTEQVDPITSLLPLLDARHPLLFMRRGEGIAGLGEAARLEFRGPDRLRDAAEAWKRIAAASTVRDEVGRSGTGLVAFGAFAFADESACTSVLIVPRVVIGRRDGVSWVTRIDGAQDAVAATALGPEFRVVLHPGELTPDGYREAVATAIARILAGGVEKVVLARDLVGRLPDGGDLRRVLVDLALGYPDTWTFAVDGLIGSSPETLVRVSSGTVTARVLAGSAARGTDGADRRRGRPRPRHLDEGSRRAPVRRGERARRAAVARPGRRRERAAVHPQAAEPLASGQRRRGRAERRVDRARPGRGAASDRGRRRHTARRGAAA